MHSSNGSHEVCGSTAKENGIRILLVCYNRSIIVLNSWHFSQGYNFTHFMVKWDSQKISYEHFIHTIHTKYTVFSVKHVTAVVIILVSHRELCPLSINPFIMPVNSLASPLILFAQSTAVAMMFLSHNILTLYKHHFAHVHLLGMGGKQRCWREQEFWKILLILLM